MKQEKITLKPDMIVNIPGLAIPGFRSQLAIQWGVHRNLIIKTWGGLGDQVCAEPTLRYALEHFKDVEISLASERPELFRHLKFKDVFDLKREQPIWENYFPFETIHPVQHLTWQFISHMTINCVDYPSLCAFRSQLPIKSREVKLWVTREETSKVNQFLKDHIIAKCVAVHAGRHWQSKTFPVEWWNETLSAIQKNGFTPVLIGAETDDNRGTVNVDSKGCLDLRGKLSIMESVALLKALPALITNDSSPLHLAADSDAWIGYIATCKHPDNITHWRRGQWSWRMENLGLGGIWELLNFCPNVDQDVSCEFVGEENLRKWLPAPNSVGAWLSDKLNR